MAWLTLGYGLVYTGYGLVYTGYGRLLAVLAGYGCFGRLMAVLARLMAVFGPSLPSLARHYPYSDP